MYLVKLILNILVCVKMNPDSPDNYWNGRGPTPGWNYVKTVEPDGRVSYAWLSPDGQYRGGPSPAEWDRTNREVPYVLPWIHRAANRARKAVISKKSNSAQVDDRMSGRSRYASRSGMRRRRPMRRRVRVGRALPRLRMKSYRSHLLRTAPVAKGYVSRRAPTKFGRSKTLTLSNREFIADVSAITGSVFTLKSELINPGNATIFRWLSSLARHFDKYKFVHLSFEYEPQCSTTTPGQVCLGFDSDPNDVAPATWADCASYNNAKHGPLWSKVSLSVGKHKTMFVRSPFSELQAREDLRNSDSGFLFWATDGNSGATAVTGKLYCNYTVKFYAPESYSDMNVVNSGNGVLYELIAANGATFTTSNQNWLSRHIPPTGYVTSPGLTITGENIFYTKPGDQQHLFFKSAWRGLIIARCTADANVLTNLSIDVLDDGGTGPTLDATLRATVGTGTRDLFYPANVAANTTEMCLIAPVQATAGQYVSIRQTCTGAGRPLIMEIYCCPHPAYAHVFPQGA